MGTLAATLRQDMVVNIHPGLPIGGSAAAEGLIKYSGAFRAVRCTLTGSASYLTGGDTIPDVGIKHIEQILVVAGQLAATALNFDIFIPKFVLDGANRGKVQFVTTANAEVANATNMSAASWDVIILGRSG